MTEMNETEPMTKEVAEKFVSKTDDNKLKIIELEERFRASAKFLDEATGQIKESWIKWLIESKGYLEEARTWRMAIESESKTGLQSCKDILEFLGSPELVEKKKNLKELVELAERLKTLKESGFLDSLVDTLIKIKP